jgi:uncharacterized protein (TIGR02217 family)
MRLDAAHELIAFFEARVGRLNGFRFRDPVDFRSCAPRGEVSAADQVIGAGDGATAAFQLVKRYDSGGQSHPVSDRSGDAAGRSCVGARA